MRRILVLEDDPQRIRKFRENFVGNYTLIVTTAAEAIVSLKTQEWDWLFLDHDLGGKTMVESGPGTGYEVACFLEEHPDRKPPHIAVHSFNPTGTDRIMAALPDAVRFPSAWDYGIEKIEEKTNGFEGNQVGFAAVDG
jgi:CheY-like chemotaxis protein